MVNEQTYVSRYISNPLVNLNLGKYFDNWIAGQTGSGLTQAQIAQNEYQTEMANTQYQRGVEDMKKAGLNPALMYGQGASPAPSPSGASVGEPNFDFGQLVSALMLPKQIEELKSRIDLTRAEAENKRADTQIKEVDAQQRLFNLEFDKELREITKRGRIASTEIQEGQAKYIYKNLDKLDKEIDLLVKQAATEEERKILTMMQARLADANARQIIELLPYEKAFKAAATQHERAAASAAFVHAAYEQGMIDSGYIDTLCREAAGRAATAEQQAIALEYSNAIKSGNISEFINKYQREDANIGDNLFGALSLVTSTLGNVFAGVLK